MTPLPPSAVAPTCSVVPEPCEKEFLAEARAICRDLLDKDPDHAMAFHLLGLLAAKEGQELVTPHRRLDDVQAQLQQRKYREAVSTLREVLNSDPTNLEALSRLIFSLELLGDRTDAAHAWLSLGAALDARGRIPEAISAYQQAVARQPDCLDARIRLGTLHLLMREPPKALQHLDAAVAIAPEHVIAHVKRGQAKHLLGKPDEGWTDLAWLFHEERVKNWRAFEQPMWDGSSLSGRTVLLWATPDFGLGDTLQFVRFASRLKARGARRILVECQPTLVSLIARMADVDHVSARWAALPGFDVHVPMMLVPVVDRAAREPRPSDVPYLSADPGHVEFWRAQRGVFEGRSIGLCWGAHSSRRDAGLRSAPLSVFAPLSRLKETRFVSLQLGPSADEAFTPPPGLRITRMLTGSASVAHTAALMQTLDPVITVDTIIAHLAGALGRPVWTLLPYGADWRWAREETTAWYPTMRLFHQANVGDWANVLERVCEELVHLPPSLD